MLLRTRRLFSHICTIMLGPSSSSLWRVTSYTRRVSDFTPHCVAIIHLSNPHKCSHFRTTTSSCTPPHTISLSIIITSEYFLKLTVKVIDPLLHKYRTERSYRQATDPNRVAVLSPDMRRIRARQQELAARRSVEAAEEEKKRKAAERERRRVKSPEEERWDKLGGEGSRLGDAADGDGVRRRRR